MSKKKLSEFFLQNSSISDKTKNIQFTKHGEDKLISFNTNYELKEPIEQEINVKTSFKEFLKNFLFLKNNQAKKTFVENIELNTFTIPKYSNEFWTSKQRQASSIHEISYRACFKPQLPHFFIKNLTKTNDTVYDPFNGRGTTVIEAGLLRRNIIANDVNPLSKILTLPRFEIPSPVDVNERLQQIRIDNTLKADLDLSMFFHPKTEAAIVSLKEYLLKRKEEEKEDTIDRWIKMVATNRLTGHSKGFFSVYTLPPNQAVSPESQVKINQKLNQVPEYREIKHLILTKTKSLLRNVTSEELSNLRSIGKNALFLTNDARETKEIGSASIQLTVTSPPFLDVVQYSKDNWLRCWFNSIDDKKISKKITMVKTVNEWSEVMKQTFTELFRVTKPYGWVAFEVGEVKHGKIKLEEYVIPLGVDAGFTCEGILINSQSFTKTSNIWGIHNNTAGTNTNRIIFFQKN